MLKSVHCTVLYSLEPVGQWQPQFVEGIGEGRDMGNPKVGRTVLFGSSHQKQENEICILVQESTFFKIQFL